MGIFISNRGIHDTNFADQIVKSVLHEIAYVLLACWYYWSACALICAYAALTSFIMTSCKTTLQTAQQHLFLIKIYWCSDSFSKVDVILLHVVSNQNWTERLFVIHWGAIQGQLHGNSYTTGLTCNDFTLLLLFSIFSAKMCQKENDILRTIHYKVPIHVPIWNTYQSQFSWSYSVYA